MRGALLLICAGMASATFVADVSSGLRLALLYSGFPLLLISLLIALGVTGLPRRCVIALLFISLGICWHLNWAQNRLSARLSESLEGETLTVSGVVTGLPERSPIAQQFQFQILHSASGFYPRKVVLNYYGDVTIEPGQYWRFAVRLNRPHGFANPGGFDYEAWLLQRGINARGYVRDSASNRLLAEHAGASESTVASMVSVAGLFPSLSVWLHQVRHSLKGRLRSVLGEAEYAGLLIALLLGDRSAISQDNWQLFTATGSNHLFVISGLHIGMISGFAFWSALLLGRAGGIPRLLPLQKFAAGFALAAAFMYALLAGFTLPTQRAFIMITVLIAGLFWNTRYQISFRLIFAAFVVLLLNPLAIVSSGFWLSFTAVAALLAFAGPPFAPAEGSQITLSSGERMQRVARYLLRPQLIVFVALAIPLVFFTQQVSFLAPLVNVVAIPMVGLLIVPMCFVGLLASFVYTPAAGLLFGLAHHCIVLLLGFMELLERWAAAVLQLQISQPNSLDLVALIMAVLVLLLPVGVCRKWLVLPLLLGVLPIPSWLGAPDQARSTLQLHVIDVGQGLAVIVQTARHTLLFDTGARLSPDFNVGSAVVLPALRSLGVSSIDAVVVSHGDNDHAGGLSGIEPGIAIGKLIGNGDHLQTSMPVAPCRESDSWNWDGVEFRFLDPGLEFDSQNNRSCVLQIRSSVGSILLPGDIEREAEAQLAKIYGDELASAVLIAPHHGSRSSSSYAFLKRVDPDYVVFSAGYRNSFGHPHQAVRARYQEFASRAFTSADSGMISIVFRHEAGGTERRRGAGLQVGEFRKQKKRYWH